MFRLLTDPARRLTCWSSTAQSPDGWQTVTGIKAGQHSSRMAGVYLYNPRRSGAVCTAGPSSQQHAAAVPFLQRLLHPSRRHISTTRLGPSVICHHIGTAASKWSAAISFSAERAYWLCSSTVSARRRPPAVNRPAGVHKMAGAAQRRARAVVSIR